MGTFKAPDDDALKGVRSHAELSTRTLNGIPVFDVPDDFPLVTDDLVRRLTDED